jgi:uncharacterized protein involved in cysteine biosynthesis
MGQKLPFGGMSEHAAPWICPCCGYPLPRAADAAAGEAPPCRACGGSVLDAPLGKPIRPGRRFAAVEVAEGFVAFWRAAIHLLTRPEYFGRLAVPVAANLIATALVAAAVFYGLYDLMAAVAAEDWGWLELLRGPVSWGPSTFPTILTAMVVLLLAPAVIQTMTVPFLDPLADTVEVLLGGPNLRPLRQPGWQDLKTNVRASAQVLAMQVLVLIPCLLLSFCYLGLPIALAVSAMLSSVLWFEIPFVRRGASIEQRIRTVRHNWGRALGFGLAFGCGMAIPFFTFLLLAPTAAVAVTTLYFHFDKTTPARGLPPPAQAPALDAS